MATNTGIPVEEQPTETARASLFGSFTLINHGGLPIALSNRRALAILAMRREQISLRLHSLIDSALEDIGNAGLRKRLLGAWAMQQPSVRALFTPVPSDSKTLIAAFAFQVLGSCRRAGLFHLRDSR